MKTIALLLLASVAHADVPWLESQAYGTTAVEVKAGTIDIGSIPLPPNAATESTLASRASEATAIAISTTLTSINKGIVVSTLNSTSVALGAGGVFTGTPELVTDYQEITLNLFGLPATATATIVFEFSPNGTNWDVSIPFQLSGPGTFIPLSLRNVLPYYRVRYNNGPTPLTALRLTSVLHKTGAKHLTRFLNQSIAETEPVENVRAFIGGKAPNGDFVNLPASGHHLINSSTVPLIGGGSFIGQYLDISQYSGATVSIQADASGTLFVDHSIDGITANTIKPFHVSSGTTFFVGIIPLAKFIRIRYVNNGVAQTMFQMSTIAKIYSINPLFEPLNSLLDDGSVAQLVKAVIAGKDVTDGFYRAVGLEGDRLRVVSPPPAAPPGTSLSSASIDGTQTGATDFVFVIPSGSTMTLQQLTGGAANSVSGGKVELFFDPAGTGIGMSTIEKIFCNGITIAIVLGDEFVGNGTRAIRMRRTNLSGGALDMFARWRGYVTP